MAEAGQRPSRLSPRTLPFRKDDRFPLPALTVHLSLAQRVLEDWTTGRHRAPFDPLNPGVKNAFLQGALGPDLGYFPGGDRPLSELAHTVRPADLSRELLHSARSPVERAFALGWATHVLADQLIHPLVGRGVGRFLTGRDDLFIPGTADQVAHLRVEIGLDSYFALVGPRLAGLRLLPVFDAGSVHYLSRAYVRTYGLRPSKDSLLRCHERVSGIAAMALPTIHHLGRSIFRRSPWRRVRRSMAGTAEFVRSKGGRESLMVAMLTPVRPTGWLVRTTARIAETFPDRFARVLRHDLADLPNLHMETGQEAYRSPPLELQDLLPRALPPARSAPTAA